MVVETICAIAGQRFVERLASNYADKASTLRGADGTEPKLANVFTPDRMQAALSSHLRRTESWASHVQFFLMPSPERTENSTVALPLTSLPRKFQAPVALGLPRPREQIIDETGLLSNPNHYVLLGAPGAGKTTTMKRLTLQLMESMGQDETMEWTVPVQVVMRDHGSAVSITEVLLDALGLQAEAVKVVPEARPDIKLEYVERERKRRADLRRQREENASRMGLSPDDRAQSSGEGAELDAPIDPTGTREYQLVAYILDCYGAVVLLDGLDEVHVEARTSIERSIVKLAGYLRHAKIVVSCRSGDYARSFDYFHAVEILELTPSQIRAAADMWLKGKSQGFIEAIERLGSMDLIDRPLFLGQAMVLYSNTASIPDQPFAVCRQMVRLMLQDWDRERFVLRGSRYKAFDTDSKFEFLTRLAYEMTFELRKPRFTGDELVACYDALRIEYGLPQNEAALVAQELETHTGIFVEAGHRHYEFSHLSIQEYLAAEYVVRLPDQFKFQSIYQVSPNTMAVAVALSSDPSAFFVTLAYMASMQQFGSLLPSFLSRLMQERPRFKPSSALGAAVLRLIFYRQDAGDDSFLQVLANAAVIVSVRAILANYNSAPIRGDKGERRAQYTLTSTDDPDVSFPKTGSISRSIVKFIAESV